MALAVALLLGIASGVSPAEANRASSAERYNPENRVWDFFSASCVSHPENRLQTGELHQESCVAGTTFASGSLLFLQRDPEGYRDSVNLYAGMAWDTVNQRDPTGRSPSCKEVPQSEMSVRVVARWCAEKTAQFALSAIAIGLDSPEHSQALSEASDAIGEFSRHDPELRSGSEALDQLSFAVGGGAQQVMLRSGKKISGPITRFLKRRSRNARRARRMGETPLDYEVMLAFAAKSKKLQRVSNVGYGGRLGRSASELGVSLPSIRVGVDRVARFQIQVMQRSSFNAIEDLRKHLRSLGAKRAIVRTGEVVNPLVRFRLKKAAENGEKFLGGDVRQLGKSSFEMRIDDL